MDKDFDARARAIHTWWNKTTGQDARLTMDLLRAWMDLLMLGHNGSEVRRVLHYLRREIRATRRQRGALALYNFLRPENFEKDLALANMEKDDFIHSERRLPASPDQDDMPSPTLRSSPITSRPQPPKSDIIAKLRTLKQNL